MANNKTQNFLYNFALNNLLSQLEDNQLQQKELKAEEVSLKLQIKEMHDYIKESSNG